MAFIGSSLAEKEIAHFMYRVEPEPSHVLQVTRLTGQLFDSLQSLHQCIEHDRFLLISAAMLHDIGWSTVPSGKKHHKESARLIREHEWKHLEPDDIELIAQIARYHRKSPPAERHAEFLILSRDNQERVRKLAALLRIADALDRGHVQKVKEITCKQIAPKTILSVRSEKPLDIERDGIAKKSDLFRDVFGREIVIDEVRPPETG